MDDEHSPKFHVNTHYLPLVERDKEKSSFPPPPPPPPPLQSTIPTWRIKLSKYWPFVSHLALIALVSMTCLRYLDGRDFNINSRRPQYREVDGSVSQMISYAPLQSDITTAVSLAATVTRVAGGWWATGYIWRCIFVAMERGGISAKGVSQAISSWLPAPRHFTRKSSMVIIYLTLFATFAVDYFSAVLTGSFIWEAANTRTPGRIPLAITNGTADYVGDPIIRDNWQSTVLSIASASASIAWMLQSDSLMNIAGPSLTCRRVIQGAQYISTNSILAEVMMPYFAVDAFEWVQDPHQVLTDRQISLLAPMPNEYHPYNPFLTGANGAAAFLPNVEWGKGPDTPVSGYRDMPISESRLFAVLIFFDSVVNLTGQSCPQNYTIDPGLQINLFGLGYSACYGIANVSYRAGVFRGRNYKFIAPNVVEAQAPSSLIGNPFTSDALGLTPILVANLLISKYAMPLNYSGTLRDLTIELTSRAYQAAWATMSDYAPMAVDTTTVQIALPTLRAKVVHWRVYLWVALHLWMLALGLLFIYVQSHCGHPWVEDPTIAVFWLDTRAVLSDPEGQRVSDPWQPGTEICEDGMLILEHNEAGQSSVQLRRDSGTRQRRYADSIPLRRRAPASSFTTLREEGRESVETLIGTSVPTSLQTSSLNSTKTPENSVE